MFIALAVALVATLAGGATMAWFTDSAAVNDVTFSAGTLAIEADQSIPVETTSFEIVNPGDAYCVGWEVENVGTKRAELRFDGVTGWGNFELDSLADPAHIAICPNYQDDWKIAGNDEGGFAVYYTKGPVMPGEKAKLVLVVAFDGPEMGNDFQGETFALTGKFDAVQASHGAAGELWGADWKTAGSFALDKYFANYGSEDWPECCKGDDPPSPDTYLLTVEVIPSEGGIISGSGSYAKDTEVLLEATANPGYTFDGWYKDDAVLSTDSLYRYTMPAQAITLIAKFKSVPSEHNLTVLINPKQCGGVIDVYVNGEKVGQAHEEDPESQLVSEHYFGNHPAGAEVKLSVNPQGYIHLCNGKCSRCGFPLGKVFTGWKQTEGDAVVLNKVHWEYSFTMPYHDVTFEADYNKCACQVYTCSNSPLYNFGEQ